MATPTIQTSFAAGEISPSLYGRVDLAKWRIGASTMRNFFVNYRGGAMSRAGTAYVGMCKQGAPNVGGTIPVTTTSSTSLTVGTGSKSLTVGNYVGYVVGQAVTISETATPTNFMTGTVTSYTGSSGALVVNVTTTGGTGTYTDWTITGTATTSNAPRDIRFQYNESQGYATEFGHFYMRVKFQGAYVTEEQTTTLTTNGTNVATVSNAHGIVAGQLVSSTMIIGGQSTVTSIAGNTVTMSNTVSYNTGADPNAIFSAWCGGLFSGPQRAYIYGMTPNIGDWLYLPNCSVPELNNKIVVVTGVSGGPNPTTIMFTDLFGNAIPVANYPGVGNIGLAPRIYTVASPYADVDVPWIKFTQSADTMSLTCINQTTGTEYPPYDLVRNGNTDWVFTATTFAAGIIPPSAIFATAQNSTTASTWYSYVVTAVNGAGEESNASPPVYIENNDISVNAGSNNISVNPVNGAVSYNFYAATPSYAQQVQTAVNYGYDGTSQGPSFTDTNITPDFTTVPPVHQNPFARGAIIGVIPTAPSLGLTQSNASYVVNTSTGSGFQGVPVIINGGLSGFVIQNGGQNYAPGDTITIGVAASGTLTFASNMTDGEYFTLGGVHIVAKTSPAPGGYQFQLGSTLSATLQNFANYVAAQAPNYLPDFDIVNVSVSATVITFTYYQAGTAGNSETFTAGTSGATASPGGGTLGGGASPVGTAALTIGPAMGTYPSTVAYFQQRRVYGNSLNNPDTLWMSQPGAYTNMDSSIPVTDSDAITATPWSQQVNGIQHMLMMPSGLIVLTGNGAWQIQGPNGSAVTPSNIAAAPQAFNGINALVPPTPINYDIIYLQSKGSIFRDLSYNFFVNIYTGTDMTVLSNHLFYNFTFSQIAWCEEPYKVMWTVRNDGAMLSFTYLKEQDVYAWARHDTNGLIQGVCSVTEPPVDALYLIVKRLIQVGTSAAPTWVYYSERMDNRLWSTVEDAWCVDCGLAYPMSQPNAVLTPSAASGTVTMTASASVFANSAGSGAAGDVIRVDGGIFTVTIYVSGTQVTCSTVQPLTSLIPNDPLNTPAPALAGAWSIATPTSTVTGLNHLNGMAVSILGDGNVFPQQVVSNGTITLSQPCSAITIGLPFTAQLQTLYLDPPGQVTAQGRRKTIFAVTARVEASRGFSIGSNQPDAAIQPFGATLPWGQTTPMIEWKQRGPSTPAGQPMQLFTGDVRIGIQTDWVRGGQAAIQQTNPLPVTVLAMIPEYTLGDTPSSPQ